MNKNILVSEVPGGGGGCTVGISSPRTIILWCLIVILYDYDLDFITKVTFLMFSKQILSYRYNCPVNRDNYLNVLSYLQDTHYIQRQMQQ